MTAKVERRIREIVERYPAARSALVPALSLMQRACGGALSREDVRAVAPMTGHSPGEAWGAATFYSMIHTRPVGRFHLQVDTNVPAMLAGADEVFKALEEKLNVGDGETTPDGLFTLSAVEDLGAADISPVIRVNDTYYGNLTVEKASDLVDSLREGRKPAPDRNSHHETSCGLLLKNFGLPDSSALAVYSSRGGYRALERARRMKPETLISTVEESDLRGRGGAGFPTGRKWRFLPRDGRPVTLICNADEGEPGTFKDRQIMERDPHLLVEGIAIAARATGAARAFVYIRGEYRRISGILETAIGEADSAGLLEDLEILVHRGAGSYICGEETALIASLEGGRGEPRPRPPYPADHGLYGDPTVVNNVETLASLPVIVARGAETFRRTRPLLFSLSGHVRRRGLYECSLGTPLEKLLARAGGIDGELKGVIVGGLSSPILTAREASDLRLDYDSCRAAGASLGSGAVIVLNEEVSIPRIARRAAMFFARESCGQCAPCREGSFAASALLARIVEGSGSSADLETLLRISRGVAGSSLCPAGDSFAAAIGAMVEKFHEEFQVLV